LASIAAVWLKMQRFVGGKSKSFGGFEMGGYGTKKKSVDSII
jgi:hypothetical protein